MDLCIDEKLLDDYIAEVSSGGALPHKGIMAVLINLRLLGYLHRGQHNIILQNGGEGAELNESYAKYLDKKASGLSVDFKA